VGPECARVHSSQPGDPASPGTPTPVDRAPATLRWTLSPLGWAGSFSVQAQVLDPAGRPVAAQKGDGE